MFDIRYQYALHTTSFEEQHLSDRTLSRFRARVLAYETEHDIDLIHECTVKMAKETAGFMNISPTMQRMDSLMVAANIKNLSLLELFYTCVANLVRIMDQRRVSLPKEQRHYTEKDDYNRSIYHQRELDATERTIAVIHDTEKLIRLCDETGDLDDTSEYQLLIRLLKERTITDNDGNRRLRKKEEVEHASEVLLNPADPEATYRYKAGGKHLGHVGNIVESVGENVRIITDYAYEKNTYADNQFMKDYLEKQDSFGDGSFLVADGAYSGEANSKMAECHNFKLITTNFTGYKPDEIYADFKFTEDGRFLMECINGCKPEEYTYDSKNERSNAYFKTEEFSQYVRFRNGVEAIPSLLRRKYHVDRIPTHGKIRTRFHFGFKIAALNFQTLLDYTNDLNCCARKCETA